MLSDTMMLGGGGRKAAFSIENSLLFQGGQYLSRTPSVAGNRRTWTFSAWVRRGNLSGGQVIFAAGSGSLDDGLRIETDGKLKIWLCGASRTWVTTLALRDPTAWQHVVLVLDTANAVAGDRMRLYVNGGRVTAFDSTSVIAQDDATTFVNSVCGHTIGRWAAAVTGYLDGYMSEIAFVDGQALSPAAFGEIDSVTGSWRPKKLIGFDFGANGFHLGEPFEPTRPGIDRSHNLAAAVGERTTLLLSAATAAGTIFDWSPAAVAVTNTGVGYSSSAGKFGPKSFYANGSQWLTAPADVDFGDGDFTIEMWVNPDNYAPANYAREFAGTGTLSGGSMLGFAVRVDNSNSGSTATNGQFLLDIGFGGTLKRVTSSGLPIGSWSHVCFMRKAGMLYGFRDGVPMSSTAVSGSHSASGQPLKVGDGYDTASNISGFIGCFDQVRISKRACYAPEGFTVPGTFTPGSHFAATGFAATDVVADTPTNVYATLNPLVPNGSGPGTFADGNLTHNGLPNVSSRQSWGTVAVSAGKWYWEFQSGLLSGQGGYHGVSRYDGTVGTYTYPGQLAGSWSYRTEDGCKVHNGQVSSYGERCAANDIIGVALDMEAGTLAFRRNGVWQGNAHTNISGLVGPAVGHGGEVVRYNFGQRPFAHTPPEGFKPLCSANLPATTCQTPGSFTGNANIDGPVVYTGAVPQTLSVNGNAVTWGVQADKLATGFKIRTDNTVYNTSGTNTWTATYATPQKPTVGPKGRAPANAQGN